MLSSIEPSIEPLLKTGEIGIYTLPTDVELTPMSIRGSDGKPHLTKGLVVGAVNSTIYNEFIGKYKEVLERCGITRSTTGYDGETWRKICEANRYLYDPKNNGICSGLGVRYMANNLNSSENFAIYIGIDITTPGKVTQGNFGKIIQKSTVQFTPKNMISFCFIGSHIHVIAFCTNINHRGGGGRLITILKETCKATNIPCISLYALKSAESYYLLQGFVFLTDNDGNVVTQGRHKAMIWYNPSFNLNNYLERDGLHTLSELNVPSEDYNLNRVVNDKLKTEEILAEWIELANHSIASEERHQDQEIVNEIEASPEILNSPQVLTYIQDTQPEQYDIMIQEETKKRSRSSSRTSIDDEEPIIYGKPDTKRPSIRRNIVVSDDEGEYGGGSSRRRKRVKKTKKAKRKYKKNKRTYKR